MDADILDIIMLSCGAWYISFCIVNLDGPGKLFKWLRDKHDFGGLFSCIYCLSFWIAIALYVMLYNEIEEPVYIMGVCGMAHMLASFSGANYYGNQN